MSEQSGVSVLGIFVADTAYLAQRMPQVGETISGSGFSVGPGGKGSNQSVAAARAGAEVTFISKIGKDIFGEMALETYKECGVNPQIVQMDDLPTGAAFIYVNEDNGENAIIVYPGAAGSISSEDVHAAKDAIIRSKIFVTQLEQPVPAALTALKIAKDNNVITIFNPAPAEKFPDELFSLCDYIIPNETEAAAIVGFELDTIETTRKAGDILLEKGVGTAIITLGERGVLCHSASESIHVPAVAPAAVIDTAGAGDAFVGGFSAALSNGQSPIDAVRFGCATAGIAVTRRGTAPAMPSLSEINALIKSTVSS